MKPCPRRSSAISRRRFPRRACIACISTTAARRWTRSTPATSGGRTASSAGAATGRAPTGSAAISPARHTMRSAGPRASKSRCVSCSRRVRERMPDKVSALLLFGATGDLARRMLLPSLYGLDADGLLPDELTVIGTARSELDDDGYRAKAREALDEHLPANFYNPEVGDRFLKRLRYVPLDIGDESGFSRLAKAVGNPAHGLAIFLSTAPSLFTP